MSEESKLRNLLAGIRSLQGTIHRKDIENAKTLANRLIEEINKNIIEKAEYQAARPQINQCRDILTLVLQNPPDNLIRLSQAEADIGVAISIVEQN